MEQKPEMFKDISEEDLLKEDEKPGILKKIIIIIAGGLLVLLMISYLFPLQRIGAMLESEEIDDNFVIILDNDEWIIFSEDTYLELKDKFNTEDEEFKVCLLGEHKGNRYIINDHYYPRIISSSFVSVTSEGCSEETLISMHSHPSTLCLFSRQDMKTFKALRNPDAFIGLMCRVDRFNFYGYQS